MMIGLDTLRNDPSPIRGRRIGVISNHTGVSADFTTTPALLAALGAKVSALFGPEHGYAGVLQDALTLQDEVQEVYGVGKVPIYSLYRADDDYGVPPGSLDGLDLLVYDIQDVGARYYTYPSTLGVALEASAAAGIPLLVLDRPNPIGGAVEGPRLDEDCRSFVGLYDVPVRHGMTLGELARYINKRYVGGRGDLQVQRMVGWTRDTLWPDTGLPWIAPSPNIPTYTTALVYPGTCLFEGLDMSEGRGTTQPFELIGAPWIEADDYAAHLNNLGLPGVSFRAARFMPAFNRYADEACGGVQVYPTDPLALKPVELGLHMVVAARRLYPDRSTWRTPPGDLYHFDRLIGSRSVRPAIDAGAEVADLILDWERGVQAFVGQNADCLLYS